MNKIVTAKEALSRIKDGDTLLVGGFLQGGSPEYILGELVDHPARHLTIVNNDMGLAENNLTKIMENGRVDKIICTYIGLNPMAQQMYHTDPTTVELNPQGTLAERIRCAGAGIAGFYTPTGVGTVIEEGKEKRSFDGVEYLFERALSGDVAIVHAAVVDESGNCFMKGSSKNFNAVMPAAAEYVIVEAEKIVPVGEIDSELVTVPGIFIDAIVSISKEGK